MARIERTRPIAGARVVPFGYVEAERTLGSLVAVRTALGDHAAAVRVAARTTCVNWRGAYRDEFERALCGLDRQVIAAASGLAAVARMVTAAVDAANQAQHAHNQAVEIPVGAGSS
jgi:hypothetical protein